MSNVTHGGDIMLYINTGTASVPIWTPLAHATSHSISHSMAPNEVSSKDTGKNTEVKPGKHGLSTINISGLHTWDGYDYFDLKAIFDDDEEVLFKLSGRPSSDTKVSERAEAAGDKYEEGKGYITELSREAPHDGSSTYSAVITVIGKTTTKVVAGT